jgi:tetraacyldisaccharide 4'-kinase
MQVVRLVLLPLSMLYATVVFVRNRLYDLKVLKSRPSEQFTIVVGNLSVGGTGKSPFTEFLITQLQDRHQLAVLSRGHGRSSTGFVRGETAVNADQLGDEPWQIKSNFPNIPVFVDEDRHHGLRLIKKELPECKVVILDDAFQHRKLIGNYNILLTLHSRPFFNEWPLPSGRLRDNRFEKRRADSIVVTKCPAEMAEAEKHSMTSSIGLRPAQDSYFSSIIYLPPRKLWGRVQNLSKEIILITGIARTEELEKHVHAHYTVLNHLKFPDHHQFDLRDLRKLRSIIDSFARNELGILTTQKDASRLKKWKRELADLPFFELPIAVDLHGKEAELIQRIDDEILHAINH